MSKRAKEKAELIANGIMISVQGKTGRVVYNTKEKSFTHYELMCAAQKGYEQAEKDLVLTWKDIRKISRILDKIVDDDIKGKIPEEWGDEEYYEEVLRRFNKSKEEVRGNCAD